MKKFLIASVLILAVAFSINYVLLHTSFFIDFNPASAVNTMVMTDDESIYVDKGKGYELFEIRGVNLGNTIPGKFSSDFGIKESDYLRWFKEIQDMGANTIRVYNILNDDFYNAFYKYNKDNSDPLYLIHGLTISDYVQNSHLDAWDEDFYSDIMDNTYILVDIIHGKRQIILGGSGGGGTYFCDISPWVLGYIIGSDWNSGTIAYTNRMNASKNVYIGDYMYTSDEATPFEAVLTMIGDTIIKYETERYEQQRLVAFFNWPSTDPFEYPEDIMEFFKKSASVDVEHILTTDSFISGQFASYHAYPYYPGYLNYYENKEELFTDENGELNTYTAYLKMLKEHHTMPVVITEFGIPSARGMAHEDANKGYNQGRLSEEEQGLILVDTYNDILSVDLAGCLIYMWQDDWTRSTWNTQYAIDTLRQPYWSDYQTSDQFYGILTFDPGEEESICYTDGNTDEWTNQDIVSDNGDSYISMKYDEKFIYFLVYKSGYSSSDDIIYIPVDTTQKSGSLYCSGYDVRFERAADFLIVIDGTENSRVVVQERYDVLRAMYNQNINGKNPYSDPPDVNSPIFKEIRLILQLEPIDIINNPDAKAETYETGILTYGNGNPDSDVYNSLSDYIISGDYIEIRIPWELFNYSDPSKMMIHDDYYQNYGVESISIDTMYIGVGTDEAKYKVIRMDGADMKRWDTDVTYHERLKSSYYMLQEVWTADE